MRVLSTPQALALHYVAQLAGGSKRPLISASINRLDHVAVTTIDVAALREYLHVSQQVTPGSDGSQWLTVNDPDGTCTEIMHFHAVGTPCCSPFTASDPEN